MSWQTHEFRKKIDAAKSGDKEAIYFVRVMVEECARSDKEGGCPDGVIIECAEIILERGIEEQQRIAEMN